MGAPHGLPNSPYESSMVLLAKKGGSPKQGASTERGRGPSK